MSPQSFFVALRQGCLLLVPCAFLSFLLLSRPDFLLSSDSLFPAAFVWDAMHHRDAWSGLQQPHIPSFFPDLLVQAVVQTATGSWRLGTVVWVFVALGWLATILTWITSRMVRNHGGESASRSVIVLLVLVMTAGAWGLSRFTAVAGSDDPFFPWLLIVIPYTHGGPFLLALTIAAIASQAVTRPSVWAMVWLTVLSFAVELSDQLCLISLLAPLTAALIGGLLVKTVARRPALLVLSAVWGGGALGSVCVNWLDRQEMPLPSPVEILGHIGGFIGSLAHQPVMLTVMFVLVCSLAREAWRQGFPGFLGDFWSVFAATSAVGSIALTMILYEDVWSYRYALPALWWAFTLAAAGLAEIFGRRDFRMSWGAATVVGTCLLVVWPEGTLLAGGLSTRNSPIPRLSDWGSPLASCLRQSGLRAGLADFWLARGTSAASDWDLQVDPINGRGAAHVWGNNRNWFAHDIHDAGRPPPYQFIILDRLSADRIAPVYGQPDRIMMCGATTVWLYDEPGRLNRDLQRASPFLAETFAAGPAR
jgi:hypothetical protein